MNSLFNSVLETAALFKKKNCESEVKKTMKEEIKITITITDDSIVLYCENTQDLTEDDIIDINKMLDGLAKTSSSLQEGDPTNGNA